MDKKGQVTIYFSPQVTFRGDDRATASIYTKKSFFPRGDSCHREPLIATGTMMG